MRPRLLKLLPIVLALASRAEEAGAATNRFPIGIYGVTRASSLRELREAGFDSFVTYNPNLAALSQLAAEAKKTGLSMLAYPPELRQSPARVENWPIEAWYLHDEPDVDQTSPAALKALSASVRTWDPKHFQTLVVGEGTAAQTYGGLGDILMLDWYPIPHLPIDSVADQIDEAYRYISKDKPLWMVVQAFDWKDYPQRKPKGIRIGRFPDMAEIRFMSYLSIVHGAKGIFYFTLTRPDGESLTNYPELWRAVTQVVGELRAMQPIFKNGNLAPLPFTLKPTSLEARSWRYRGRDYVIILNRKENAPAEFPEELLRPEWRPLFEARRDLRDLLKRINGAWHLPPYRVIVLERDWL